MSPIAGINNDFFDGFYKINTLQLYPKALMTTAHILKTVTELASPPGGNRRKIWVIITLNGPSARGPAGRATSSSTTAHA